MADTTAPGGGAPGPGAPGPSADLTVPAEPAIPPEPGSEWPDQIADRIVAVVDTVRDKTTVPITVVGRALVFGLVAAVLALAALTLLVIAVVRLHVYLPFHPVGRQVWVGYAILGAIFTLAGLFCWGKRTRRGDRK